MATWLHLDNNSQPVPTGAVNGDDPADLAAAKGEPPASSVLTNPGAGPVGAAATRPMSSAPESAVPAAIRGLKQKFRQSEERVRKSEKTVGEFRQCALALARQSGREL